MGEMVRLLVVTALNLAHIEQTSSTPSTTTTMPGRHPFDQKVDGIRVNKS